MQPNQSDAQPPKPTGFIVGALLEAALIGTFLLFFGLDHVLIFVGLCGLFFALALLKVATTPADRHAGAGVDPDHARIASLNRLFPQAVLAAAIITLLASLLIGTNDLHALFRETFGFPQSMTRPFLPL
ncbi:MAG: hypothetical protein AAFQ42_07980 [Pseudomonadota bacterium]